MPLSIPKFIKTAFAQFGMKNSIPETTNNITGAAGYNQGFSEINMLPEGAGGIPPDGKDFNGIFYEITSAIQYIQSGVTFPYNQDFADAIGGYDVGALVTGSGIRYVSTISGNSVPPPSAGWQSFSFLAPTETVRGLPLVATNAEVAAGTNASKMVTPAGLRSAYQLPIGQGQTWQDVSASRSSGVTYTNSTGRSIFVAIRVEANSAESVFLNLVVDGKALSSFDSTASGFKQYTASVIVPNGSSYSANVGSSITFTSWLELR